jgi:tetratricopeptide (TPR) repeat protein
VHASSTTRFEQAYREIAAKVRISGHDDPSVDILVPVSRWLSEEQNGPWLIILDNADDAAVFFGRPDNESGNANSGNRSRPLISFIPSVPHGMVLVTSRDMTVAYNLIGDSRTLIKVKAFDKDRSLELLKTKVPVGASEEQEAFELIEALDYIPLAITQAGAHIRQKSARVTIQKYLALFRKNRHSEATLLNRGAIDLRRDSEVPNAVISTWEISFLQIRKQCPPAADLLSLMSMFSRQGIPEFLIRPESHDKNSQSDNEDSLQDPEIEFEAAIGLLINFSMVRPETNKEFFEMHRLVQVATKRWLQSENLIQDWESKAIAKLADTFPNGEFENWTKCAILLPHVKEVIAYQTADDESNLQRAVVLGNVGWYEQTIGHSSLAVQMEKESLRVQRQFLKEDDSRVLGSMGNLAVTYMDLGQWKEAEELQTQVKEIRSRVLGEEHPHTLTSISNLASTFRNQGRWKEAEELQTQVKEIRSRVLGEEHPDTLTSISNLASTFWKQGRWKEAEELKTQVKEIRSRVLGEEHPHTLISMNNLASTFQSQGRWKEAEELQKQVKEIESRVLGEEHPHTLTSISNLASTFRNQERWKEAEELQKQVKEIQSRVLGEEHPDTLTSIINLASTFWKQGRWKEAEELETQVKEIQSRVLGEEHPDTLTSIANLAHTYKSQGKIERAVEMMREVAELRSKVIGADHPATIDSLKALELWTSEELSDSDHNQEAFVPMSTGTPSLGIQEIRIPHTSNSQHYLLQPDGQRAESTPLMASRMRRMLARFRGFKSSGVVRNGDA